MMSESFYGKGFRCFAFTDVLSFQNTAHREIDGAHHGAKEILVERPTTKLTHLQSG